MKWIEPSPAYATCVVVGVDPLQPLKIALTDILDEFLNVLLIDMKLFLVIPELPAILA